MQLSTPQFRGVLHKPRIGIVPDPFPPGESGLATRDYLGGWFTRLVSAESARDVVHIVDRQRNRYSVLRCMDTTPCDSVEVGKAENVVQF